jgi:hypothetical protein
LAKPIDCWKSPRGYEEPKESIDMDVWVRPSDSLLQVADESVGVQTELPSSKLVLLDEKPVLNPLGRERLLEVHLDEFALAASETLPRVEATPSDGALLKTLGVRLSMPMTKRPLGVCGAAASAPNSGSRSSRMEA